MSTLFNTEPQQTATEVERYQLEQRLRSGAHWFYWIAALSLVTSLISLSGGQWGFAISLGVTQFLDAVANGLTAQGFHGAVRVITLAFDLGAVALFAALGYLASKGHGWAFILGMVLYALDGVVTLLVGLWLGTAFHAFALYSIYGGYRAYTQLKSLAAPPQHAPPPPPAPAAP
jgi:hypothetical protein